MYTHSFTGTHTPLSLSYKHKYANTYTQSHTHTQTQTHIDTQTHKQTVSLSLSLSLFLYFSLSLSLSSLPIEENEAGCTNLTCFTQPNTNGLGNPIMSWNWRIHFYSTTKKCFVFYPSSFSPIAGVVDALQFALCGIKDHSILFVFFSLFRL